MADFYVPQPHGFSLRHVPSDSGYAPVVSATVSGFWQPVAAVAASGTTGTGVAGAAILLTDGTSFRLAAATSLGNGLFAQSVSQDTLGTGENTAFNRIMTLPAYSPTNITATGTTVAKTGAGVLHTITCNKKGTSSNTLTLYDNTSAAGTVLATIDTTSMVPGTSALLDIGFGTGLTLISATGTAGDLTISWI